MIKKLMTADLSDYTENVMELLRSSTKHEVENASDCLRE